MSHRTALPATFALGCACSLLQRLGGARQRMPVGDPSSAFVAFRQMERDLINGIGPQAQYQSSGYPGFGLWVYETN